MQRRNLLRTLGGEVFDFGNALNADRATNSNYVELNKEFLDNSTKFTINFWVIADTLRIIPFHVGKLIDLSNRVQIDYFSGNFRVFINNNSSNIVNVPYNLSGKTMITLTFDASLSESERGRLYANGVLLSNISTTATSIPQSSGVAGAYTTLAALKLDTTFLYRGGIFNEIGFIDGYTATASDVSNLYNNGNGQFLNTVISGLNDSNTMYFRCNQEDGETTLINEYASGNGTMIDFATPPAYFENWNNL